jgi:adenylate cyclase
MFLPGLLSELKRRSVFRVAVGYLVGAWLLTEVAGVATESFDAPGWVMRIVIVFLLIAFVPAIVLAWLFEITPDGLRRDDGSPRSDDQRRATAQRLNVAIIVLLAAAVALGAVSALQGPGPTPASTAYGDASDGLSLAVLPFVNMSPDVDNAHFADGIAEELLNVLARVDGLHVASRTSAFAFRDSPSSIPEIARQLGVGLVLEGSVRKQGARVRITAQLIDARRDKHLWSNTYDRDLTDIFVVQEEIAGAIVAALAPVLGIRHVTVAAVTADLEAYEHFLRGRSSFHERRHGDAIPELSAAVRRDPEFAEAWAFLSASTMLRLDERRDAVDRQSMATRASDAAARALDLHPDLPLALAVRANLLAREGRALEALVMSGRAAAVETPETTPKLWHGVALLIAGYVDEAVPVLEEASRRESLVMPNAGWLGAAYVARGAYRDGETLIRRAAELAGSTAREHWQVWLNGLAIELANRGDTARAALIFRESDAFALATVGAQPAGREAFYMALADPTARPEFLAGERQAARGAAIWGSIRWDYLALGDADIFFDHARELTVDGLSRFAFYWLRVAWQPGMVWLREDPRFLDLMRDGGMIELWEVRGYPLGCRRLRGAVPERLSCPANPAQAGS